MKIVTLSVQLPNHDTPVDVKVDKDLSLDGQRGTVAKQLMKYGVGFSESSTYAGLVLERFGKDTSATSLDLRPLPEPKLGSINERVAKKVTFKPSEPGNTPQRKQIESDLAQLTQKGGVKENVRTFQYRFEGVKSESSQELPPPYFGGQWHIPPEQIIDPERSMRPVVVSDITGADGHPAVTSGGALPHIVQWAWDNGEGFTLLIDIAHIKGSQFHPGEWVNLDIGVLDSNGFHPIRGLEWPEQGYSSQPGDKFKPERDSIRPTDHRSQVAINISKKDLLAQFPNLTNEHTIGVKPHFSWKDERHFHTAETYSQVKVPPIFDESTSSGRLEFNPVPINKKTPLSPETLETHGTFLAPETPIVTSIETESELTIGGPNPEQAMMRMIQMVDGLVGKPPSETNPNGDPGFQALQKLLGQEGWHVERKGGYDVLNAKGDVTDEARGRDHQKYGVAPPREELQALGLGRPGLMVDRYLYVGPEGSVRQRDNFKGAGVLTVKGAHRRSPDGAFMSRYCREVRCSTPPVSENNGVHPKTRDLLFDPEINFQDALFLHGSGSNDKLTPSLEHTLTVESERYRYLFVHKDSPEDARPVMVELSFDISTGISPDGQTKQTVYQFEFGLDHLGSPGAPKTEGGSTPETSTPPSETTSQAHPKETSGSSESVQLGNAVKDRAHDGQDLDHRSVMSGKTYTLFQSLVQTMTGAMLQDTPVTVAGEKALTLKGMLSGTSTSEPTTTAKDLFSNNTVSSPKKPTSVMTDESTGREVNTAYWYEDNDMDTVLELRRAEVAEDLPANTQRLPATNLQGLRQFIGRDLGENGNVRPRTLLVPLNVGGGHWTAVKIHVNAMGQASAQFADPLGGQPPRALTDLLQAQYGIANIEVRNLIRQRDGSSCGPCTIENLLLLATGNDAPQDSSMVALRGGHVALLHNRQHPGAQDFDARQRENRSTVANLQQQQVWLQSLNTRLTGRELQTVLGHLHALSGLQDLSLLTRLGEALRYQGKYSDNTGAHLSDIRAALFSLARETHDASPDGDYLIMSALINSLLTAPPLNPHQVGDDQVNQYGFAASYEELVALGSLIMAEGNNEHLGGMVEALLEKR